MDKDDTIGRSWRRIAYKLKGEGLYFEGADRQSRFEALLLGTTDEGFLLFDPEQSDDQARLEPFERIRGVMPLPETRAAELRAAFERSAAAS
jgi:hypothetical protein